MSRVSRRGILGGAAALVPAVGVGATLPPSPDAEVLQLYATHARNHAAVNALSGPAWEDEEHPSWLAYNATYRAVKHSRPATMEGVLAKARIARLEEYVPEDGDEDASDWAGIVLRDLLRLSGG